MTYTELFEAELRRKPDHMILPYKDIVSGELHREVGGYPARSHHMPQCCQAMYNMMAGDDEVLEAPPSGKGAYVKVRYYKKNHCK